MNILFCGTVVPEKYDTKLKYLSPAGNRFQINIIRELEKQGHRVTILSYIGFPLEEDVNFEDDSSIGTKIIYCYKKNGMKQVMREYTELLCRELGTCDVVMSYNVVHVWFLLPILAKWKKRKSLLLLADFTESSMYESFAKQIYAKFQLYFTRKYGYVVGLSKRTRCLLKSKQKFMLMEGGISRAVYDAFEKVPERNENITVMYSGLLEDVTGIQLLLEAFAGIENNSVRLLVSGKGKLLELVERYASADDRISNLGYMEYDRYLETVAKADILVNPRDMRMPENQNNFPSKLMEYLATGNRILSTRFVGYERFEKHVEFCESSAEDMQECLEFMIDKSGEDNLREENRTFSKQFLWENQARRMIEFWEE